MLLSTDPQPCKEPGRFIKGFTIRAQSAEGARSDACKWERDEGAGAWGSLMSSMAGWVEELPPGTSWQF